MKGEKKLECPVVSQICTLRPRRFHQEFSIFSLMQPVCPDIPVLLILTTAVSPAIFF